jgi:hypothetical protein
MAFARSTDTAPPRPDCLEIFGGRAEVSYNFSQWGWNVLEPIDQVYGMDLSVEENRGKVLAWIRKYRPRLVLVEYPCKVWSPITNLSYPTPQARRRLRKRRLAELPFLEFCEKIFHLQLELGGDALGENPLRSASFDQPPLRRLMSHPAVFSVVGHGCRYGIKHAISQEPLLKPTVWFSTSQEICDELSLKCKNRIKPGDHTHDQCLGGARITEKAGQYTKQIAQAIHKGFVRLLKRKEPSRIRSMLRQVGNRIRKGHPKDKLRWTEKTLKKAIDQWSAVYVADNAEIREDPSAGAQSSSASGSRGVSALRATSGQSVLSDSGIVFDVPPGRKLSQPVQQALRKIHCNLGHPSPADLERFLKLGGVQGETLEAIKWMKCMVCSHSQKPKTHRAASIPPSQVAFGDEIHVDCFQVHDTAGKGHWFLSIVDRATSYHMVGWLEDHSPKQLYDVLFNKWISWAGPPNQVTVDMEGGFRGIDFWHEVGKQGSVLLSIAGTAHWQAGKVERHNQIIKDMIRNVANQVQAKGKEAMEGIGFESCWAKNSLVREHGWSPVCLVFGREPRAAGELVEAGNPVGYHLDVGERSSDIASRMRFRYHAKMEYVKAQAKQMLMKTVHQRTRKLQETHVGQLVFFYRDTQKKKDRGTCWVGPGYIVGHQGTNVWIACGGRCFLVANEHVREAVGDESNFGDPEVQKLVALFKRVPNEATYEDLTNQESPKEDAWDMVLGNLGDDLMDEGNVPEQTPGMVPRSVLNGSQIIGWTRDDYGNPMKVDRKAWAYVTPIPRFEPEDFPYRTTWGYRGGRWIKLEQDVPWATLSEPCGPLVGGPVQTLVSIFAGRSRKQICSDSVPWQIKKKLKLDGDESRVMQVGVSQSSNKLKKMLDKEIPYDKIDPKDMPEYQAAIQKEWDSWLQYDSCQVLSHAESERVEREFPDRILPSRLVMRNKHAGLVSETGQPLPLKAKARLCIAGHLCPDTVGGDVQVDSPTIERIATMLFLNYVVCNGWFRNWFIGDISNAFLQGAPLEGPDMFMRQPRQGLPGLKPGQLIKLIKSVYGRPDAPRSWFNELSRILQEELNFQKSEVDPALYYLRDPLGELKGMLIVHVDDIMLAGDDSPFTSEAFEKLHQRFPFGTWLNVEQQSSGVSYCGKEIRVEKENGQKIISLSQDGFISGRLESIPITAERKKDPSTHVSETELTDYRSAVGSLQWLSTQSRADISFETNQLQKRIKDLRVFDLQRANRCIKEVKENRHVLKFRPLGHDWEIAVFHDAALYNSVGTEVSEQTADVILQIGKEKKMIYSQKGVVIGAVPKNGCEETVPVAMNVLDWKSSTDKRVVESSLAAETHAAILGHGLGRFLQVLTAEARLGSKVMYYLDEEDYQSITPMTMITDCRSIYDHIKKDGQHLPEKGNILQVVLLRKMCAVRKPKIGSKETKARLLWVPTRNQIADGLTKYGRARDLRSQLGWAQFHEIDAKAVRPKKSLVSVNLARSN